MPTFSHIVSVVVCLVLVAGSALPCPCGPGENEAEASEGHSCCAGMAVDDEGQPADIAASDGGDPAHDPEVCPHCQPDETTLAAIDAQVAPTAVLVLPMVGAAGEGRPVAFDGVVRRALPRGPPDAPTRAAPPGPSNRDLLHRIDVLRC